MLNFNPSLALPAVLLVLVLLVSPAPQLRAAAAPGAVSNPAATPQANANPAAQYLGFDRNDYPGDAALPILRKHFSFVGYWITNPPGEQQNSWAGKRSLLLAQGFGFLVLANGRLDAEILAQQRSHHITPAALGQQDGLAAIAAATREHFPPGTTLFLDQEEGGRLLPEQAAYLFSWTGTVAASSFHPGSYLSGQPVDEGHGQTITTAQDIQQRIVASQSQASQSQASQKQTQPLHRVAFFVYQDACPPSNGCTLHPPPLASSGHNVAVWQYAQSPRRPDITRACAKTYARDGNCYLSNAAASSDPADKALDTVHLDLNVATSPDPSHGR
jgi:Domain of unknown function (DUF1906)